MIPKKAAPTTRKVGAKKMPPRIAKLPIAKAVAPAKKAAPAEPPMSKAQKFATHAESKGWDVERKIHPAGRKEVIATREYETVTGEWVNEVAVGPRFGTYIYPGGSSGLKNAASALRVIDAKPGELIPKVLARPKREPGTPKALRPSPLPFDPYETPDAEIIEACRGKNIVWLNSLNPEEPETGYIPPLPPPPKMLPSGKMEKEKRDYTEITSSKAEDTLGERILHFLDPQIGFRALHVGAIIRVG